MTCFVTTQHWKPLVSVLKRDPESGSTFSLKSGVGLKLKIWSGLGFDRDPECFYIVLIKNMTRDRVGSGLKTHLVLEHCPSFLLLFAIKHSKKFPAQIFFS